MIARNFFYLCKLSRDLRLHPSELQRIQCKMLKSIIKHAYENVLFYHKKFREAGIKPSDISSIEDISKLPITTKQEIQEAAVDEITSRNLNLQDCIKRTTSGSTGVPLTIYIDKKSADFENALWSRTLFTNGLKLRDKMAVIADPRSFPKRKFFGLPKRKYLSIFDSVEKQFDLLNNFKPEAIRAYPSSLLLLAENFNIKEQICHPRLIFSSAELLDSMSRKLINSSFDLDLFDNYASNEFGLLAWECQEHKGYHINMEGALMEFIEDGTSVSHGERGEIVCTGLLNRAMPLIRYKTNDVAVPMNDCCPCGKPLPMIDLLEGRKDDFLRTTNGRLIPPTIFFPYPFEHLEGIRQFRVIQIKRDKMLIQLSVKQSFANDSLVFDKARKSIQRIFGEDMQVDFKISDEISRDQTGKLRKVVSLVH